MNRANPHVTASHTTTRMSYESPALAKKRWAFLMARGVHRLGVWNRNYRAVDALKAYRGEF